MSESNMINVIQLIRDLNNKNIPRAEYVRKLYDIAPAWKQAYKNASDKDLIALTAQIRGICLLGQFDLLNDPFGFQKRLDITEADIQHETLLSSIVVHKEESTHAMALKRAREETLTGGAKKHCATAIMRSCPPPTSNAESNAEPVAASESVVEQEPERMRPTLAKKALPGKDDNDAKILVHKKISIPVNVAKESLPELSQELRKDATRLYEELKDDLTYMTFASEDDWVEINYLNALQLVFPVTEWDYTTSKAQMFVGKPEFRNSAFDLGTIGIPVNYGPQKAKGPGTTFWSKRELGLVHEAKAHAYEDSSRPGHANSYPKVGDAHFEGEYYSCQGLYRIEKKFPNADLHRQYWVGGVGEAGDRRIVFAVTTGATKNSLYNEEIYFNKTITSASDMRHYLRALLQLKQLLLASKNYLAQLETEESPQEDNTEELLNPAHLEAERSSQEEEEEEDDTIFISAI